MTSEAATAAEGGRFSVTLPDVPSNACVELVTSFPVGTSESVVVSDRRLSFPVAASAAAVACSKDGRSSVPVSFIFR